MLGLSLTSTVAARDAMINAFRSELAAANARCDLYRCEAERGENRADDLAAKYAQLVGTLADFADRSIPPKRGNGPVAQPKSTPDADAAVVQREREKAKRTRA